MHDSEQKGARVRTLASLSAWVRSRRVALTIKWRKRDRRYVLRARRGAFGALDAKPVVVRVEHEDLEVAVGMMVDQLNKEARMEATT